MNNPMTTIDWFLLVTLFASVLYSIGLGVAYGVVQTRRDKERREYERAQTTFERFYRKYVGLLQENDDNERPTLRIPKLALDSLPKLEDTWLFDQARKRKTQ